MTSTVIGSTFGTSTPGSVACSLPPDDQLSVFADRQHVAGVDHGGRARLLDDRGALDRIRRPELAAVVHRVVDVSRILDAVDGPTPDAGAVCTAVACGDRRNLGTRQHADRT